MVIVLLALLAQLKLQTHFFFFFLVSDEVGIGKNLCWVFSVVWVSNSKLHHVLILDIVSIDTGRKSKGDRKVKEMGKTVIQLKLGVLLP